MASIPDRLIPLLKTQDVKAKYAENLDAWRKFASRIQKNSSMQSFILTRDKVCQACGKPFDLNKRGSYQVHHTDYDHLCTFDGNVIGEKYPNCGKCQIEKPSLFAACAARLAAVHGICNKRIHDLATARQEPLKPLPGVKFSWIESIRLSDGKRGKAIGLQQVTGIVESVERTYIHVKVLNARVIKKFDDVEGAVHVYNEGETLRRKVSKIIERYAKKIEDES